MFKAHPFYFKPINNIYYFNNDANKTDKCYYGYYEDKYNPYGDVQVVDPETTRCQENRGQNTLFYGFY